MGYKRRAFGVIWHILLLRETSSCSRHAAQLPPAVVMLPECCPNAATSCCPIAACCRHAAQMLPRHAATSCCPIAACCRLQPPLHAVLLEGLMFR
ncbi:unnamed protein product [Caenorhabditis angaria]|uniref:Secreted protein n=1 Tax=Caenorhabditis angaria TaxID=860376 RepID=A0A9P1IKH4_9PELO|nr:unnamed protein product [Caenorhabditis angaria]